jgi:DNA polymerase (family X)
MTNERIASTFARVAALLEEQTASPFRVRAWREAAQSIRDHERELTDVFRDHGRVGLEAIPHVGSRSLP